MTPDAIGRYQVFAQLGAGGFATVYRAYDPHLDRDVAVKVLHPIFARDPAMRVRFLQEARALASVRHRNLVRLFDAGESDGSVYLAMEFIAGRSLDRIALDNPPPVDEVLGIIGETAAALDALHAAGLVHRDVKPANIMVADDGRAVLVDLGIARPLAADGITSSGLVMGTPGFLAPEQLAESAHIDPRTDVYQLAATAFTLLAGRPPFEGSPAEVLYAIGHRAAPDLQSLCPDLPTGLAAVIAAGLAKDPGRRPATAGGFAAALAAAAQQPTLLIPRPLPTGRSSAAARPSIRQQGDHAGAPASTPAPMPAHVINGRTRQGQHGASTSTRAPMPALAGPAGPRRRSAARWPLVVVAAGIGLILLGSSAVAVGYAQVDRPDTPPATRNAEPPSPPTDGTGTGRTWTASPPVGRASR